MASDTKPRVNVPTDWVDRVLSFAGALAIAALVAGAPLAWPRLPKVIPIHFDLRGQADGWGNRAFILLLPIAGVALYGLFTLVARAPHLCNCPWAITPENVIRQYRLARRLLLAMRALIVGFFLALLAGTVLVATGRATGLDSWWMSAFLSSLGLAIGAYFVAAWRAR